MNLSEEHIQGLSVIWHYIRQVIIIIGICAITCNAWAGEGQKQGAKELYDQDGKSYIYTNAAGESMLYRILLPDNYDSAEKYPLLLFFHSARSLKKSGNKYLSISFVNWFVNQVQPNYPCIMLMPECPIGQQWVDVVQGCRTYVLDKTPISVSLHLVKELCDMVMSEYAVDGTRIYVLGSSMGGYGVWDFAMRFPDLVAAGVPISGSGDSSIVAVLKDVPIWAFHGTEDSIVSVLGANDMADAMQRAGGGRMQYTVYGEVGHTLVTRLALNEQGLLGWMFSQNKQRPNMVRRIFPWSCLGSMSNRLKRCVLMF